MGYEKPTRVHEELKLEFPLDAGDTAIGTLYLKRPRAKEMGLLPTSLKGCKVQDLHPFFAALCGLTMREFDMLEGPDYAKVMDIGGKYINEIPQTGPSESSSSADTPTGG